MKTKLLKKVRKRFSIFYHPNGVYAGYANFPNVKYTLEDNDAMEFVRVRNYCGTLEEAHRALVRAIRSEYGHTSKKRRESEGKIKVWYNK